MMSTRYILPCAVWPYPCKQEWVNKYAYCVSISLSLRVTRWSAPRVEETLPGFAGEEADSVSNLNETKPIAILLLPSWSYDWDWCPGGAHAYIHALLGPCCISKKAGGELSRGGRDPKEKKRGGRRERERDREKNAGGRSRARLFQTGRMRRAQHVLRSTPAAIKIFLNYSPKYVSAAHLV